MKILMLNTLLKKMNFKFHADGDDSIIKIINIFNHIEEKVGINLESCFYENKKGDEYLKTIVSNETFFKNNIIPKKTLNMIVE